jgi:hypothetical protein
MRVQAVATLGPFHLLQGGYNAEHVVSVLRATGERTWLLAGLRPGALEDPGWPDDADLALELAVVRGARVAGARLIEVRGGPEGAVQDGRDLRRFLSESGHEEGLAAVEAVERRLGEALTRPLGPGDALAGEVKAFALAAHETRRRDLGEGPGTAHLESVAAGTAEQVRALGLEAAALAVSADEWPLLEAALRDCGIDIEVPRELDPAHAESERARAVLDRAIRLAEDEDLEDLDHALARVDSPEARFHRATLRIVTEQFDDARVILQALLDEGFDEPPFLPGWTLARLGDLQERAGDLTGAQRSYRATLGLRYSPVEACELARAGLTRVTT